MDDGAPGPVAAAAWSRELLGPALTLSAAIAVALMSQYVGRIPNPPAILLLFVVFAAFHGGVRAGLVSGAIACLYFALAFSRPGHLLAYTSDDLRRVIVWSVAVPIMAVMVGTLKARAVAAERAAGRAAQERFTKAFHASPVGVILTRLADQRMIDANDAALAVLGYDRTELVGKTATELALWRDPSQRDRLLERLRAGETLQNVDIEITNRAGVSVYVLASFELVTRGPEPCMLSFLVDLTARRRAEESLRVHEDALRKAQNLEALGRLAGGVAHDFNNLLTVIGGNAGLLASSADQPFMREVADDIVAATERGASLTRQLLDFSRPQPHDLVSVDVAEAVTRLEPMLARTLGEEITIITERGVGPVVVQMNAGQLDRIVMNLALNARDALASGGTLTLATSRVELDASEAARHGPAAAGGSWMVLTVRDTGVGMDAETRDRIFEPFFTTKGKGLATGLGLTTVYGIVAAAGGFIIVDSAPGRGTSVAVHLPPSGPTTATAPAPIVGLGHGELVLVVEDSPSVRTLTARLVADLGYAVLVADSGATALALIERETRALAAIVTDVIMPEMSGPALIEELRTRLPAVKVLFVSGYADDDRVHAMLREGELAFLAKPFSRDELALKLQRLLSHAPPRPAA